MIIAGPLTRIGMNDAGTLQQDVVANSCGLTSSSLRRLAVPGRSRRSSSIMSARPGRRLRRVGGVERHVPICTSRRPGTVSTVVHVQKARWDPERHNTTLKLAWADGEGFELEGDRDLLVEVEAFLVEHPVADARSRSAPPARGQARDRLRMRTRHPGASSMGTRTGSTASPATTPRPSAGSPQVSSGGGVRAPERT